MKPSSAVSVPLTHFSGSPAARISIGAEIIGRITERTGADHALIEIMGKKVKAEFRGGVPASDIISMKLVEKSDSLVFKISGNSIARDLIGSFSKILIADTADLGDAKTASLFGFIKNNPADLFGINLFLTGLLTGKQAGQGKGLTELLNSLLKRNFPAHILQNIAIIMQKNSEMEFFFSIFSAFTGKNLIGSKFQKSAYEDETVKTTEEFLEIIDSIDDTEEKKSIIQLMLENIEGKIKGDYCEIPVFDEKHFSPVKLLSFRDSVFIQAEFSFLGKIDMLFTGSENSINISIFAGKSSSLDILSESKQEIIERIEDIFPIINISLFPAAEIGEQLRSISDKITLNSILDIKR